MKASVVICTYNRTDLLKESIISVQRQNFPSEDFEIIVVDNNSSDNTKEIVMAMAGSSSVKIKYVFEQKQGLSNARNTGIREANGEVIAFTDDDIDAEQHWLRELVSSFENPDVAAAGGPIRPIWPAEKPEWLTERWQNYLTISEFPHARETGEFKWPEYPWGANIAFRKEVFKTVGMFPTDLGRVGACLLSNEEINLCKKIEKSGKRIKFAPDAVIYHKIPIERLRKQWLQHRTYWQGKSDAVLYSSAKMNIYARLRQDAAESLHSEVERIESDFDIRCGVRNAKGFVHQLLFSGPDFSSNFRKMRALETFIGELTKTAGRLIADYKKMIVGLKNTAEAKDKEIEDKEKTLGVERTKFEAELMQKEERIAAMENQIRQKCEELIEVDNRLKTKCIEVVTKDRELMRQCETGSAERERLEEQISELNAKLSVREQQLSQIEEKIASEYRLIEDSNRLYEATIRKQNKELKLRSEELRITYAKLVQYRETWMPKNQAFEKLLQEKEQQISDLLDSTSWKITSPLRAVYDILTRHKK